jgi:hypothetical protein
LTARPLVGALVVFLAVVLVAAGNFTVLGPLTVLLGLLLGLLILLLALLFRVLLAHDILLGIG